MPYGIHQTVASDKGQQFIIFTRARIGPADWWVARGAEGGQCSCGTPFFTACLLLVRLCLVAFWCREQCFALLARDGGCLRC